jgi:hypothetical protein
MANLITTDDLVGYALWLSGEPTDGTSDYNERVLQHMQAAYNTFVNGGTLGTRDVASAAGLYEHLVDIPTTDWLWLRKFPPFAFNTVPAIVGSTAFIAIIGPPPEVIGTVTVTNGSATITFTTAPSKDVTGWRLKLQVQGAGVNTPSFTVPRIVSGAGTTWQLDTPWPQDTQSTASFVIFQAEYKMPADFVRFVESPMVQGGPGAITGGGGGGWGSGWGGNSPGRLPIGSYERVMDEYPLGSIAQGPPTAAARLDPPTLMMNRWDVIGYRIEFSYLFSPPVLVTGASQVPLVPERFRHVLGLGAAMLVMQDKVDSRNGALASEFREIIHRMMVEYRHEQVAASELAGRHLTRQARGRRGLLRTASGLPLF